MKWVKGAFLVGDLTLSPPLQPLTVIPDPSRDPQESIGPGTAHPGWSGSWRRCGVEGNIPEESLLVLLRAGARAPLPACLPLLLSVHACVDGGGVGAEGGGVVYITAMLLSNCMLLSLVTTMTSVIGISAFCLHCGASTTLLAAFPLPRAAGPMPHKYKHNLSYTS